MNKGIVSTGSPEATQAAVEILKAGGNAIDAAVSAVFTSMTSEFGLTGASGGGAMMIKKPQGTPLLYDFFVDTPLVSKNNNLIEFIKADVDFGSSSQSFYIGKGSIAVPGNLNGLVKVHKDLGKIPLKIVLSHGIEIAKKGYTLNKEQAYVFKILKPIFSHSLDSRKLLCKNGSPLEEGDIFYNIDFANFLEMVSIEGSDFFYKGEIAKQLAFLLEDGGLVDFNALKSYKTQIRKPVHTLFKGLNVYSNPAPSSGGSLIIFLLRLLEAEKSISLKKLLKAMLVTNQARLDFCSNPNDKLQYVRLLEEVNFKSYLNNFNSSVVSNSKNDDIGRGSTTHVSVIDKDGYCASVTTSNGEGSGYILPGTGIMLNNMLGEEDLNPQGFHNWEGKRRLATMMSPSIITKDEKPLMILGSGGSNRIRSALVQVIINYFCKNMNLKDSIESPRIHLEGNRLFYEPEVTDRFDTYFKDMSLIPFQEKNLFFGGVNAVTLLDGYSDSRRGGSYACV